MNKHIYPSVSILLTSVLLLCTLTSCSFLTQNLPWSPDTSAGTSDDLDSVGVHELPLTFQKTSGMKSGSLSCTIQRIEAVDNVSGLPEKGFEDWPTFETVDNNGQRVILRYPEYIDGSGNPIPGLSLVLVDVSITSDGAQSYTRHDLDEYGTPLGEFDDPCIFRADALIYLSDIQKSADEGEATAYNGGELGYFSGRNQRPEHRNAFRLEDGETLDITLGFWVYDIQQGGYVHLDNLYLYCYEQILTKVDLENTGGERS